MNRLSIKLIFSKSALLILIAIVVFLTSGCGSSSDNNKTANNDNNSQLNSTPTITAKDDSTDVIVTETSKTTSTPQITVTETPDIPNGTLKVHYIDVGQGDSILIQQGDNTMLIDTGERNKGTVVTKYLNSLKIDNIDYLVGTHPHSDHIGGMTTVINSISVSNAIIPNKEHDTKTYESFIDALIDKEVNTIPATAGDTYTLGSAKFTVLGPVKDNYKDLNDWSVVIKLTFGTKSFLFTGDAETLAEGHIIDNGYDVSADVLKVGHHGSTTSTSASFLNKVAPDYAIICCAEENSYGHPHDETIDLLNSKGITMYGTYKNGTIIATCDGQSITFDTEK